MGSAVEFESEGLRLTGWVSRPGEGHRVPHPGLVLCHGFPREPKSARTSANTYPQLADRLAGEVGWTVLTFNFRGTGDSEGNFSLTGWMADLRAATDHLLGVEDVGAAWLAGFSTGGALASCVTGEDERVRGEASRGARADSHDWLDEPQASLDQARQVGVI